MNNAVIEITTRIGCSINCKFCPQKLLIDKYTSVIRDIMMSFEVFKRCIDKLPASVEIHFTGMSEPWGNPECTKMVQYAARRGHPIWISTTLIGMTMLDYLKIRDIQFNYFILHIPDAEGNSCIPITEDYILLLKQIMEDFKNGIFKINEFSTHGSIHEKIKDIVYVKKDMIYCRELFDRAGNLEHDDLKHIYRHGKIGCASCGLKLNRNELLPDGSVLLCCMDYGMEHILGNLLDDTYEEILEGQQKNKLRKCLEDESAGSIICRKCNFSVKM